MTSKLHVRLMELALELRHGGDEEACAWIQKHIAQEQRKGKRRRGMPKVRVRLAKTGSPAWIRKDLVKQGEELKEGVDE